MSESDIRTMAWLYRYRYELVTSTKYILLMEEKLSEYGRVWCVVNFLTDFKKKGKFSIRSYIFEVKISLGAAAVLIFC